MWIRYIIPEDGDSLQHPNIFKLDVGKEPTLLDIEQGFPIPGKYYFRFLKNVENFTVWIDASESDRIPLFQGTVVVKANRAIGGSEFVPPPNTAATRPLINIADEGPKVENNSSVFPDDDLLGFASTNSVSSAKISNQNELFGLEILQPTSLQTTSNRNPVPSSLPPASSGYSQNNKTFSASNSSSYQQFTPLNNQRQPVGGMSINNKGYDPFDNLGGQMPYPAQAGNRSNIPPKRF